MINLLKIKNTINLERLKDFGFIKYKNIDDGEYYYCICNLFIGKDRKILQDDGINSCKSIDYELNETEIDILYDLIINNLVEKVES